MDVLTCQHVVKAGIGASVLHHRGWMSLQMHESQCIQGGEVVEGGENVQSVRCDIAYSHVTGRDRNKRAL